MQGMNGNSHLKPSMADRWHIPPVCMWVYMRAPAVKKEKSCVWAFEMTNMIIGDM